ncbi:MAG: type II toxin-antitoxin system RelE/ParE family toxin [Chthoniobacterales bacterium]|nr:type II toxin-antitoxin system RelE/ParE family toxin [Chthoniobacterales bacterium]
MILSFSCQETEKIAQGLVSRRLSQNLQSVMHRKLRMLNAASQLRDLLIPPNNSLESLKGDRRGEHSIRINQQWRLCFTWTDHGPINVEIVDYH